MLKMVWKRDKAIIQSASYTNIGGREENEDYVQIVTAGGGSICCSVADGLGGHGGGRIASQTASGIICSGWKPGTGAARLDELFQEAHRAVLKRQDRLCSMKTTVVVLSVCGRKAAWAHVGDSRLYRFDGGTLAFQTRDHSLPQVAVQLGEITPEQIRFHPDRNRVLRALGQEGDLNVATGEEDLRKGHHAFLLCSDGFWEYVYESEMISELHSASSPGDWLERMRRYIDKRAGDDNDNNTAAAVWVEI